jgi:translation initiation factor 1
MKDRGRLAWSTERGENPKREKASPGDEPVESRPPSSQAVRVRREKGGRGGKTVTVAGPLILVREEASALLAAWKKLCGSGGTLKRASAPDGSPAFEVEIQGDHADRLLADLEKAGYKAKRSGG